MPGYKVHLIGGGALTAGIGFALVHFGLYQPEPMITAMLLATALMGSLFPDTDTNSMGQHIFYAILVFCDVVLMVNQHYEWAAILGLLAMMPAIGKHRGWTHTWWAMCIVPAPIMLLPKIFFNAAWEVTLPFYLAALTGYFSHLLLDRKFR